MNKKPNILFIFPDQQRGDSLGCMGHPAVKTPHLDKLAEQGVNFTRCSTNSPLCVPARAALQTGTYVSQNGAWNNALVCDPKSPSYVRNIRDAGYHTAVIGKTHLWLHLVNGSVINHTNDYIGVMKEWGFEDVHELTGPMASTASDSPYTDYLKEKGSLSAFRKYCLEYVIRNSIKRTGSIPEAFQEAIEKYGIKIDVNTNDLWLEPPLPLPTEDHYDSYVGWKTIEWIENYQKEDPFFMMVGFTGPHSPFDAPAQYQEPYHQVDLPLGIMAPPAEPVPDFVKQLVKNSGLDLMTPEYMRRMMAAYYGNVSQIDEYIGGIMQALDKRGMLDNTWVVYSSDHGEMLGDHRLKHKMTFYEGALHIPCIIKPPGGTTGWQSSGLTDQLDLAATMLDIAEATPIANSDGRSLKPQVLNGPSDAQAQGGKDVIFSELGGFVMAYDGQHKLVVDVKTRQPQQLFDVETDPQELNNAVHSAALASIQKNLLEKIEDHLARNLNPEKFKKFEEIGSGMVS